MAAARGCRAFFSSSLRLRAPWGTPVSAPLSRGVAPPKKQTVYQYYPGQVLQSTDECPSAPTSHMFTSSVTAFSFLRHTKGTLRQLERRIGSAHFSDPSSHNAAATTSSPGLFLVCTRRHMATLQAGAPASVAPGVFASTEQRGKSTTAELSPADTAADLPAVIHQTIKSEQEFLARANALKTYMLAANWQDYLSFVLNSAFWEAEMRLLEVEASPFKNSSTRVEEVLRDLRRLFDLMAQVSDVRDHINQILELSSRATGLAGTGLNASEKVENFEDHVQAAVAEYDRLLKEYPEYCSLVDDCLGSGLAMMRQKQRFTFSALHRFFY